MLKFQIPTICCCAFNQINSAAALTMKRATDHKPEDFSYTMGTNFESPYHLCQLSHPLLKASGNGSIVFISSIAGVVALPAVSVYAASKGKCICTKAESLLAGHSLNCLEKFISGVCY